MYDEKTGCLLAPRVNQDPVPLPMRSISEAERRILDVAHVNAHKAPELLAVFNLAYLQVREHLTRLEMLLVEAKKSANKRRAVVLLDEVPRILREKQISSSRSPGGSEDQRQAVLDQDAEYEAAMDRVHIIEAMVSLLEGKEKGFEWAYTSVKKVLGAEAPGQGLNQNRNLSAGAELPAGITPGTTVMPVLTPEPPRVVDPNSPRARFGGAK